MTSLFTLDNAIDTLCIAYSYFCGFRLYSIRNVNPTEILLVDLITSIGMIFYKLYFLILFIYIFVEGFREGFATSILEVVLGIIIFFVLKNMLKKIGIVRASPEEVHPIIMLFYCLSLPTIIFYLLFY